MKRKVKRAAVEREAMLKAGITTTTTTEEAGLSLVSSQVHMAEVMKMMRRMCMGQFKPLQDILRTQRLNQSSVDLLNEAVQYLKNLEPELKEAIENGEFELVDCAVRGGVHVCARVHVCVCVRECVPEKLERARAHAHTHAHTRRISDACGFVPRAESREPKSSFERRHLRPVRSPFCTGALMHTHTSTSCNTLMYNEHHLSLHTHKYESHNSMNVCNIRMHDNTKSTHTRTHARTHTHTHTHTYTHR